MLSPLKRRQQLRAAFEAAWKFASSPPATPKEFRRWWVQKLKRLGSLLRDEPEALAVVRQQLPGPFSQLVLAAADDAPVSLLRRQLKTLTEQGHQVRFALWLGLIAPSVTDAVPAADDPATLPSLAHKALKPVYDNQRRELRFRDKMVKQFRQPAKNQQLILQAFEEQEWPPRINDPLPGHPELDTRQRLADAVRGLNNNDLLLFELDGTSEGILWKPRTEVR